MKKIIIAAALILAALIAAQPAAALMAPPFNVTINSYEPAPANPGKLLKVWVKLDNIGTTNGRDVTVEFIDNYPFSLYGESERTKLLGWVPPLKASYVEYTVRVDEDAVQGTNYIKLRYSKDGTGDRWTTTELPVTVSTLDANLAINSVETEPETLIPGKKSTLKLRVKNLADSPMQSIGVKLQLQTETSSTGTTITDLPFVPIDSATEKKISWLRSGETAEFLFSLKTYPDAEAGVYKVPVTLTFSDTTGNDYEEEELIGLVINSEPELSIMVDESEIYGSGDSGNVVFRFVNKGFSDVKFLNVNLVENEDFELLSPSSEQYIGSVDSDDYETVEYRVLLKNGNEEITFPLSISYRDSNNNLYEEEAEVNFRVISADKLGRGGSSAGWVVVLLIAIGVAFWAYKRKKKKPKK